MRANLPGQLFSENSHVAPWTPSPGVSNTSRLTVTFSFPGDTQAIHFWLLNLHTTFENKLFLMEYENLKASLTSAQFTNN